MKKKYIIIVNIVLIISLGAIYLLITNKNNNSNKIAISYNIEESPYNLEQINEMIEDNYLIEANKWDDEAIKFGYVITHYYDYFNKNTKLMVVSKYDLEGKPIEYRYINYAEYQEALESYKEPYLEDAEKYPHRYAIAAEKIIYEYFALESIVEIGNSKVNEINNN